MKDNMEIIAKQEEVFESFKHENGNVYWFATDFMKMLGYDSLKKFKTAIDRATKAMISAKIDYSEEIILCYRAIGGEEVKDYKLTRFACYMISMNANTKHEEVAKAQVFFASIAKELQSRIDRNQIDRLRIREELSDGYSSLRSIASAHDVENYATFIDAGFIGMYNMKSWKLKTKRGLKYNSNKLYDTMSRAELAANLFRVTQTEEKIKKENISGQHNLEKTHRGVGAKVRKIVQENMGINPEEFPQDKKLPEVKKELKSGHRNMKKLDK